MIFFAFKHWTWILLRTNLTASFGSLKVAWKVSFAVGDFPKARNCVLSGLPGRSIPLPVAFPARAAAFLTEVIEGGSVQKPLIVSCHSFADDPQLSSDMLLEIIAHVSSLGFPWTVCGHVQAPAHEQSVAAVLGTALVRNLDDASSGALRAAGPARRRRLDFGISGLGLPPSSFFAAAQCPRALVTTWLWDIALMGSKSHSCRVFHGTDVLGLTRDQVAERFDSEAFRAPFTQASDKGVDEMWRMLPRLQLCGQHGGHSRHSLTILPARRRQVHEAASCSEPLWMRRLRLGWPTWLDTPRWRASSARLCKTSRLFGTTLRSFGRST